MLTLKFVSLGRGPWTSALALCSSLLVWTGAVHAQTAAQPAQPAQPAPAAAASAPAPATPEAPAGPAAEDTNHATMNNNLSAFGSIGYGYGYGTGYGLGARYQSIFASHVLKLPPGKHDEFGIEFGLDYYHVSYSQSVLGSSFNWSYNEFTPVVGVTWNFWLTDKLMVYPKFDFGYRFISWNNNLAGYDAGVGHIYFQGTGGIAYDLGPVKLRAELGWASLHLGAAIALF
ncbi:MAG: hypothetical protein ABJB12_03305 [Pseudomonadota bacterium]